MEKIYSIIRNRSKSGQLYRFWTWPWQLLAKLTHPVHPGIYLINIIFQRIFRINSQYSFMVHYTSYVSGSVTIGKGVGVSFASSGGCYIQGDNGIVIGDETIFAPGVKIISANHNRNDFTKWDRTNPITIGSNCWIGANAVILPGVSIGNNAIIGAGAVVNKSIADRTIVAGVPAKIISTL